MTIYDSQNKIVKSFEKNGARYILSISLNMQAKRATFTGQANKKVVVSLDDFKTNRMSCTFCVSMRFAWSTENRKVLDAKVLLFR